MTMGIMPITGIPLPFMSLRRLVDARLFVAIGLVLNVHMRRFSLTGARSPSGLRPPGRATVRRESGRDRLHCRT